MNPQIDCLFIGHNEMRFSEYEKSIRQMGPQSGSYRDLSLNFLYHQDKPFPISDLYNLFHGTNQGDDRMMGLGETFSLTIAYLGTYLKKNGFRFDFINSFQAEKEELAKKLQTNIIMAIAIPTTLYVSVLPVLEIVSFVKKYNKTAQIIIGGPFIASQMRCDDDLTKQYLLKTINADFFVDSAQGEATLVKILFALKNGLPLEAIPNLIYRNRDQYLTNTKINEDNILDDNVVDWSLFSGRLGRFAAIRTAISCPFSCSFCAFPQHAGKYQTASLESVERELDSLVSAGMVASVNFIDDTFNVPPERFKELLRMLIRKKYPFKWNAHFRCQFADREMVELMKESGCEGVFLGIESGSELILKNMNKRVTVKELQRGMALLNELEIISYASFIIGFPGETQSTVRETVEFIERNQPTFYRTQLWYCDPLTPIWKEREKYRIENSQFEWSHATMDAQTACDLIEEIFSSVKNSTWVPQYNFEFEGIFKLIHRGYTLQQVKDFITAFNNGVKEKIANCSPDHLSPGVLQQLQTAFLQKPADDSAFPEKGNIPEDIVRKYQADFGF